MSSAIAGRARRTDIASASVITLRDVLGYTGAEVCNVLAISDTNERVLLHRARSRVRAAVERYLEQ